MEIKKNDKFTVTIEDMGEDGAGIGRVDGYIWFAYALASEPAFLFNSSLPDVTTMITPRTIRRIATIS